MKIPTWVRTVKNPPLLLFILIWMFLSDDVEEDY